MTDKKTRSGEAVLEEKQADETLRSAAWRLESIIEGTHVGTWEWNVQTGETVYNEVWAQIIGYTLDELTPISVKTFETFVHPDDLNHSNELLERHFAGELPYYDYDCRMKHKDGHWVWVHDRGRVITRTVGGKPLMMFGTHTDITERKQADEALVSSLSLLKATMESTADGILVVDLAGRITLWNHKFTDMWHIPEEIMSSHADELALNYVLQEMAQPEEFLAKVRELYGQPEASSNDRFDLADGRTFQRYSQPQKIGDNVVGRVWSFSDITERKQAEEALQESLDRWRVALDAVSDTICLISNDHTFLAINETGVRALNLPRSEIIGRKCYELVHGTTCPISVCPCTKVIQTGLQGSSDYEQGGRFFSLEAWPLKDRSGNVSSFIHIVKDITERKRAESDKEALQAQLRQSQKMEAIGELAGGVAHDFNNLLTGILGSISLVRGDLPAADPLLEYLNAAETAARQAADLTKGLLTFSRSAMVLPVSMKITDAIDTTLVLLKQSLPATIKVVRDDEPAAWNVLLDQSQMTQILLNLAVNARDAMKDEGTLTICTRNEVVEEDYVHSRPFARMGEFVHLSVTDTGSGMSSEVLQHLFEPFYTTKPVGSGTGLGLSIVYGAVKQAGGWVTVESKTGAGATFDIYLPRCLSRAIQSPIPNPLPVNVHRATVLVVEDEPVVSAVAQALLSRSGYAVLAAPDGASALNILREHPEDVELVLLDMTMPGMTTGDIVRAIRALGTAVPILLNSGYTTNDAVQHMIEEGSVQGFLSKPYDLHQLVERVQELLRRS
jgi:two-component system cell cycle sensor histidine kinase/response regulator CckA